VTDEPKQGRTADLPLEDRRAQEIEKRRELDEGLTRRHLAAASYERAYAADQLARAVRMGPALKAARGERKG
jgi:hypothetical protein